MIKMTKRIYEQDSYCKEFKAIVESCEQKDSIYEVVLDQTAFFPEGGGQRSDEGTIDDIPVSDVQLVGDVIVHTISQPLNVGSEVTGKIDWNIRFSRMQSHTAEHIISGITHSMFGYSNVGFHMSENNLMTVDFDGKLTKEDIDKIEKASNNAIYDNIPVTVLFPSNEEAKDIQYRSKIDIEEGLRLIRIGDVDLCACCAPHLACTGEAGLVKILDFIPYKKGTRIELIAGAGALEDYAALNDDNKKMMKLLSVPRGNIVEAINKQLDLVAQLNREKNALTRELAVYKIKPIKNNDSSYAFSDNLSFDDLRYCSNMFIEADVERCLLISEVSENEYQYVVNSRETDIRDFVKKLNATFNGKGGGPATYSQGKISGEKSEIEKFVRECWK